MAHLPRLLAILIFLGVHVSTTSHGSPLPPNFDHSMCWNSFTCGGVDINYPFFLSNATQVINYTSYSCGYTDLKIFCHGEGATETPILQLGDGEYKYNYTVKDISYDHHTIVLADPDVLFLGNHCPAVLHNVTFSPDWLNYTDSLGSFTFFFNCDSLPEAERYRINCTRFNSPGSGGREGPSFVLPSPSKEHDDGLIEDELAGQCTEIVVVPVQRDAMMGSDLRLLPWEYGAVLKEGFELEWRRGPARAAQACNLCEQSQGRCSYSEKKEFLGCLCSGGQVGAQICSSSGASTEPGSRSKTRINIYKVAGISSILMLCLLFVAFWLGYRKYGSKRKSKETARIESFLQKNGTIHPKRYTYAQVKRMTKSFAEKLGQGGFGAVYRGDLSDGRQIAVKMLKDYKTNGEDFINEIASISKTSHVNVVTLLGFCLEGSERALIYDYMPNGSLERYAFKDNSEGENTLGWEKLFDIAVGIARGLEYLHRGCNTRIVHFDIKPHNILLDQDFCPKISDFGLAKLCLNKERAISIGVARGTIGYIAPEVYSKQFGAVSSKSDVYSYGMMVLEMVGARDKNINANSESSSQYFPQWIYDHLDEYCVGASEINGEITEIARKMIVVGLWCIQLSATNRPTMTRVLEMLEGSTSGLELPPKVHLS